ncbi:39S ribosomal protein L43, mitochondrial [Lucilia sericata]|uniref:39S ribosomal protein L43, mitochondrial n=1 Tax=Lucilia sericata TaxID=13632 RepID=UPI0018A8130F|nr:39S ribosomal protein L43, mitochondrial [Lucilia sericata]XP_037805992.1 39S ribosomal protein L43, mitochondrial [Lucilia sericata]XP_037805993.1 39S ribosomal protein L43, mitochondrial [Lucilia sericata]
MSNSHLFLKSGFPSAPLQNGLGRYVCQLQRVTLKFCKNNGSSKGMREFIESKLIDFAKENPGIVVYVKPRRHRTPVLVGEYLNGEREWLNCRNSSKDDILKWIELLKTQNGPSSATRLRKMWHTDVPSIQGPWTPFMLRNPENNLVNYPNSELSRPLDIQPSATEKLIELFKEQQKLTDGKSENEFLTSKRAE